MLALKYGDISGLERSIDAAYEVASQRLFEVFLDKFHLLSHLRALKNFLLLGHGDFVDTLMDSLGPTLSKPANTLSRHILTATLESAVRATSASQDSPDVLRRLDARMLEYSHGELGWEVFTLEYRLDAPVDAIVDPDATVVYKQLFGHLWQLKRIERVLGQAWTRIIGGSRLFQRALRRFPVLPRCILSLTH
jgi:gamma-tubulin complex component 3